MQVLYLLLNILCGDIDTGICLLLPKQQNRGRPIRIQRSEVRSQNTPFAPSAVRIQNTEVRSQKSKVRAYPLPPLTRVIPRGAGKCPRSGQRGRPPSGAGETALAASRLGERQVRTKSVLHAVLRTARRFSPSVTRCARATSPVRGRKGRC